MTPYRGTGWAGGRTPAGHAPAQYTGNQPSYGGPPVGQPAYSPPPQNQGYYGNSGLNQGYYGGQQQSGVELQQPDHSYQPQRGGDQVYNPPNSQIHKALGFVTTSVLLPQSLYPKAALR
ncbi:MAG: hypothetical protein Q9203_002408 [Teloschistes exilis]